MSKIKYVSFGVAGVVSIAAIGGGVMVWRKRQAANNAVLSAQTVGESSGVNAIPLNQAPAAPTASTGGLSVAPDSSARNLGQLTPQNADQSGGSTNTAAPSKAQASPDPSTFAQYDKYKDGSGALFGEIQVGTGDELTANKKAAVYYKGWLTNGQLFDSTKTDDKGQLQPFIFTEGAHQVIPGWEEGLAGMRVGGTRLVIVPPSVGYGATGQAPIPPNAVLVFQVQLVAVQ